MTLPNNGGGLAAKILAAQRGITHIKPNQKISDGPMKGHKYASKADILGQIRPAIHNAGLTVVMSMKDCRFEKHDVPNKDGVATPNILTIVTLEFTLIDSISGESMTCLSTAVALDTYYQCEFSPQKAATSAERLFYQDVFQVPVLEDAGDLVPKATAVQLAKIKELYRGIKIDRATWGTILGMSPGEYRSPDEEFQRLFASHWAGLTSEKAGEVIEKLDAIKMEQDSPTPLGNGKPTGTTGGRPFEDAEPIEPEPEPPNMRTKMLADIRELEPKCYPVPKALDAARKKYLRNKQGNPTTELGTADFDSLASYLGHMQQKAKAAAEELPL